MLLFCLPEQGCVPDNNKHAGARQKRGTQVLGLQQPARCTQERGRVGGGLRMCKPTRGTAQLRSRLAPPTSLVRVVRRRRLRGAQPDTPLLRRRPVDDVLAHVHVPLPGAGRELARAVRARLARVGELRDAAHDAGRHRAEVHGPGSTRRARPYGAGRLGGAPGGLCRRHVGAGGLAPVCLLVAPSGSRTPHTGWRAADAPCTTTVSVAAEVERCYKRACTQPRARTHTHTHTHTNQERQHRGCGCTPTPTPHRGPHSDVRSANSKAWSSWS